MPNASPAGSAAGVGSLRCWPRRFRTGSRMQNSGKNHHRLLDYIWITYEYIYIWITYGPDQFWMFTMMVDVAQVLGRLIHPRHHIGVLREDLDLAGENSETNRGLLNKHRLQQPQDRNQQNPTQTGGNDFSAFLRGPSFTENLTRNHNRDSIIIIINIQIQACSDIFWVSAYVWNNFWPGKAFFCHVHPCFTWPISGLAWTSIDVGSRLPVTTCQSWESIGI